VNAAAPAHTVSAAGAGWRSVARTRNPWGAQDDVYLRARVGGLPIIVVAIALRHIGDLIDDRAGPGNQVFGAVIVDDPATTGLDLGNNITLINGITVPTSSDLATRLLRTFFIANNPANWQNYASSAPWHISYPNVDVRVDIGVVNLPAVLNARYGNDITLAPLQNPATPAVGEVWVATQFETTSGKTKPGTVSAVSGANWQVTRKVALPSINMNNPHNMWTDRNQNLIYATQWFDHTLTVFNRVTGALVRNVSVGEAPAHVMTRTDTDQVHVTNNGDLRADSVMELAPQASGVERRVDIGLLYLNALWISIIVHQ